VILRRSEPQSSMTRNLRLSKSCMATDQAPEADGAKPVGISVSHIVTAWPVEIHVFTSLQYRQPLLVIAERGLWQVSGERIEYLGSR
jgi:hypothetical protein